MSYENAPATRMLATHCAVCRRPLVDAKSVEAGIGPDCRRKYGFDIECSEAARLEANRLVYAVALDASAAVAVESAVKLRDLGFAKLAEILVRRNADVELTAEGDVLRLRAPYSPEAVSLMRAIPGRRWDATTKTTTFPATARARLWDALKRAYPSAVGFGPKGLFLIGG